MSNTLNYVYPPITMEEFYTKYPHGHTIFESYISVINEVNRGIDVINGAVDHFNTNLGPTVDNAVQIILDFKTQSLEDRIDHLITTPVPVGEVIAEEIIDARIFETSLGSKVRKIDTQLEANLKDLEGRAINIMFPPAPLVGAVADGTDQTATIQAVINYVESQAVINTPDWANMQSAAIFIPEGVFIVSGLVLTKPIHIIGASNVASIIKSNGSNTPIFTVKGHSNTLTGVEDIKTVFYRLGVIGSEPSGYDNPYILTNQIGIKLDNSEVSTRHHARLEIHHCNIRHCGGHGVELNTSVSNRIFNSNINLNSGDGIHMCGDFNTDIRIVNCAIRRNRIGVNVSPAVGKFITTGLILGCTIESNRNGSGVAGSSTRPCVGIQLLRSQFITIRDNYFERHLNDIYVVSHVSFNRFESNYFDASSNLVPGYAGYSPITRQVAGIYIEGEANFSNTIEKNRLYKPIKPASISDEQWGTAIWGSTYEHLPKLIGAAYTQIIRNFAKDDTTTGQLEEVLYSNIDNQFYEGINRDGVYHEQLTRTQNLKRDASIGIIDMARSHTFESKTPTTSEIPRNIHVHPSIITNVFKRFFSLRERAVDGTLGTQHDAFGINLTGELALPLNKPLARQYAAGNYFTREFVGTAAPTTGTYGRGDSMINRNPSAGGYMGWVCVTAGTPGTWKGYGLIEA